MNYKGVLNEYLTKGVLSNVYYSPTVEAQDDIPYYKVLCCVVYNEDTIGEESSIFAKKVAAEQDAAKKIVQRLKLEITNVRGTLIEYVQSVDPKARVTFEETEVNIHFPEACVLFHRGDYRSEAELVDAAIARVEKYKSSRKRRREDRSKVLVVVDAENVPLTQSKCVSDDDVFYMLFCRKNHPMAMVQFGEEYNISKKILDISSRFKDASDVHIAMTLATMDLRGYDQIFIVTMDKIGYTIAEVLKLTKKIKIQVVSDLPKLN